MRRVDPILILAAAAAAGAVCAVHPVPVAAGVVAAGLALRRRLRRVWLAASVVVALIGAVRAQGAIRAIDRAHQRAARVLSPPARCELEVEVARSPVVKRWPDRRQALGSARLDVSVLEGRCGDADAAGLGVRLYGAPEDLARGDRVSLVARVGPMRAFRNPGLADPRPRLALRGVVGSGGVRSVSNVERATGVGASIDRVRLFVRRRIEATYPAPVAPFARALVLGESNLEEEDAEAFRNSGLSHLLAVSGTHLIIAVVALGRALRSVLLRVEPIAARFEVDRLVSGFCLVASWLYAELAGGGGSAYRAAAMLSVAMLVRVMGRRPEASRSFAWSILGAVVVEPLAPFELSFALSVAATAGLLSAREIVAGIERSLRGLTGRLLAVMATTLAATVACGPVILGIGPQLPLLGVAANVIAAPIGELAALPVSLVHTVLFWWPDAERGAALVASGALRLVRAVAHGTSNSAFSTLALPPPTPWQLAATAVGLIWGCAAGRARWVAGLATVALVAALELDARAAGAPTGGLRVTMLDVGQGDAALVDLPDGSLMLVDGGGLVGSPVDVGRRVVLPVLRRRRRTRIDVAVLSHPHPDHYGGLLTALGELEVGELWDSGLSTSRPGSLAERLRGAGVPIREAPALCGEHRFGAARVEVLGPCPRFDPLREPNDNSLVIRVRLASRAVLFAGDAEREQERALLQRHPNLRADVLKVGHHGSRTSSTRRFLEAVAPRIGVVSSGSRNRFGHPHSVALARLREAGIAVRRIDRSGAVVWETDGEAMRWRHALGPFRRLAP